jgi:hypothetical protein
MSLTVNIRGKLLLRNELSKLLTVLRLNLGANLLLGYPPVMTVRGGGDSKDTNRKGKKLVYPKKKVVRRLNQNRLKNK